MRVYLDTGVFVDYLTLLGPQYAAMRSVSRRGRSATQLAVDSARLFEKFSRSHSGATSCLTFYEGEEAFYGVLKRAPSSVPQDRKTLIDAARDCPVLIRMIIKGFGLQVCDLTLATIEAQLQQRQLRTRGIRAADALHIATAIAFDAELFVSADSSLLALDGLMRNLSGSPVRFVDSDSALPML